MTINLPEDLASFVQSEVQSGHFATEEEAVVEGLRLLQQRQDQAATDPERQREEEFAKKLVASGFLAPLPPRPPGGVPGRRDFLPVVVKGEPLSETIIRERG